MGEKGWIMSSYLNNKGGRGTLHILYLLKLERMVATLYFVHDFDSCRFLTRRRTHVNTNRPKKSERQDGKKKNTP